MTTMIPRAEVGRWVDHERCEEPAPGWRFEDRTARRVNTEIQLLRGRRIIARRPVGDAPQTPWGSEGVQALVFSGDGRWLWHLGYHEGSARVDLLDGTTLEPVGVHRPVTHDRYEHRIVAVESWLEMSATVCPAAPDVLLVHANAGDSFALLLTLQATPEGIVDPVGTRLYDAVADRLDEVLWSASLIAPDRLLIVDDIGDITLFAWPEAVQIASVDVVEGLRDEQDQVRIWPDDEEQDAYVLVGREVGVVGDTLLVHVCDANDPEVLLALVALDAETLTPRGLVRPPMPGTGELVHRGGDRFCVAHGKTTHAWRYAPR